ncbi:hypothetical protein [Sphingopyxis solisilvae]|uniref:hypothetical protein n=1 Tax=Sphingopyxis solisilvae TaxID=1886788 RepID=UPI001892C13C|nr:hypothetical protein [Sphingopyxis solisilvae]
MIEGLDREKVAELTGHADFGPMVDLAAAEIALGQGDPGSARRHFNRVRAPAR